MKLEIDIDDKILLEKSEKINEKGLAADGFKLSYVKVGFEPSYRDGTKSWPLDLWWEDTFQDCAKEGMKVKIVGFRSAEAQLETLIEFVSKGFPRKEPSMDNVASIVIELIKGYQEALVDVVNALSGAWLPGDDDGNETVLRR